MENYDYLLLIEDDPAIQSNNKKLLERRGYKIRQAYTLAEARAIIQEAPPRAIILDLGMPDGNGLDFLAEIRQASNIPVLMLTALGTPDDIIHGLTSGGDDYLPKPYDINVFASRIEALLRRASMVPDSITIGPLRLDPASTKAFLNGNDMMLTQKEYSLLQLFSQRPEEPLSTAYLYEKAWGQDMFDAEGSLRKAISRLRKKLEGSGYTIRAEYKEGYSFERE